MKYMIGPCVKRVFMCVIAVGAASPRRTSAKDGWPQFAGVWHMNALSDLR